MRILLYHGLHKSILWNHVGGHRVVTPIGSAGAPSSTQANGLSNARMVIGVGRVVPDIKTEQTDTSHKLEEYS